MNSEHIKKSIEAALKAGPTSAGLIAHNMELAQDCALSLCQEGATINRIEVTHNDINIDYTYIPSTAAPSITIRPHVENSK